MAELEPSDSDDDDCKMMDSEDGKSPLANKGRKKATGERSGQEKGTDQKRRRDAEVVGDFFGKCEQMCVCVCACACGCA